MVMFTSLVKPCKGQSRILEAVIAAVIIFVVFAVSVFLIQASNVKILQERSDLDRLGYNVGHMVVEAGVIESTLETPSIQEDQLKSVLQRSMPSIIFFNLTVFNCTELDAVQIELTPVVTIANAATDFFANSMEVSSNTMTYTSKKGNIYYLVLVLAQVGEGQ